MKLALCFFTLAFLSFSPLKAQDLGATLRGGPSQSKTNSARPSPRLNHTSHESDQLAKFLLKPALSMNLNARIDGHSLHCTYHWYPELALIVSTGPGTQYAIAEYIPIKETNDEYMVYWIASNYTKCVTVEKIRISDANQSLQIIDHTEAAQINSIIHSEVVNASADQVKVGSRLAKRHSAMLIHINKQLDELEKSQGIHDTLSAHASTFVKTMKRRKHILNIINLKSGIDSLR